MAIRYVHTPARVDFVALLDAAWCCEEENVPFSPLRGDAGGFDRPAPVSPRRVGTVGPRESDPEDHPEVRPPPAPERRPTLVACHYQKVIIQTLRRKALDQSVSLTDYTQAHIHSKLKRADIQKCIFRSLRHTKVIPS